MSAKADCMTMIIRKRSRRSIIVLSVREAWLIKILCLIKTLLLFDLAMKIPHALQRESSEKVSSTHFEGEEIAFLIQYEVG
jgi:hypothetical protein